MPKIESCYFGAIVIDGKRYSSDVIISSDGKVHEKPSSHTFSKADLHEQLLRGPDVLIVGTGTAGLVRIDPGVEIAAKLAGVELIAKPTPEAVNEFNRRARKERTIAVIHITC
jgi:hypothetical protein